jgi:hypothetical protein
LVLVCSLCRSPIKENDLSNLRLLPMEIQMIKLYQQNKLFECEHAIHFNKQKSNPVKFFSYFDFFYILIYIDNK